MPWGVIRRPRAALWPDLLLRPELLRPQPWREVLVGVVEIDLALVLGDERLLEILPARSPVASDTTLVYPSSCIAWTARMLRLPERQTTTISRSRARTSSGSVSS